MVNIYKETIRNNRLPKASENRIILKVFFVCVLVFQFYIIIFSGLIVYMENGKWLYLYR